MRISLIAGLTVPLLMASAPAAETIHNHPWDYQVHGTISAMSRAAMMLQTRQLRSPSFGGVAAGSGAGGIMPGVGSIANMNVVTVIVGDNSSATVAVEADQTNTGAIDATAVSASGKTVTVGNVE
jgi:hypothetical protein